MPSHDNTYGAGESAKREYERRKAKDEARIRANWGPLGGVAVALSGEKQSAKAWNTGAIGEQRVGAILDGLRPAGVGVLHDRRIPGTRANIDHIAVTTSGIWVIDTKRYKGRPELRVEGGFLRPRRELLIVNGRDKTSLADGVLGQLKTVRSLVPDVPTRGVLCFIDAEWPLIGGSFVIAGIDVLWPKKLAARLTSAEPGWVDVERVVGQLSGKFPAA